MKDQQIRFSYFLPNLFTALNLGCGFTSIVFSMQGRFYEAAMILILGAIFDSVDGRVARLTGTQSQFGEQFDSLSDLLSFCVAPALMVYCRFLSEMGRAGLVVSFVFVLCGALRLARFNANIEKVSSDFFQGLPSPSAAMALVGLTLFSVEFSELVQFKIPVIVIIVFIALLMVTNVPFASFKKSQFVKKYKKLVLLIILTLFISLFLYEEIMVLVIVFGYILGCLVYYIINAKKFKNVFELSDEEEITS